MPRDYAMATGLSFNVSMSPTSAARIATLACEWWFSASFRSMRRTVGYRLGEPKLADAMGPG